MSIGFDDWAARAVSAGVRPVCRGPLRMATDCSGTGAPELAWLALEKLTGISAHHVFSCDIAPASRRWLASNVPSKVSLADLRVRVFQPKGFTAKTVDGKVIKVTRSEANLDMYVAGFMCTPFSDKGRRLGWQDEASDTFYQSVRTIVALRPRIAIMENVLGLLKTGCIEQVRDALDVLDGYTHTTLKLDSTNFDLPHHRERVYVICLRSDALRVPADKAHAKIKLAIMKSQHRCRVTFVDWLATMQLPIQSPMSPESPESMVCENCGPRKACSKHICQCRECKKFGASAKRCKWRLNVQNFMAKAIEKKRRAQLLRQWRTIRKDAKLKASPSYFLLAAARKLKVSITSPRERCMLDVLSGSRNMFDNRAVLDLSQSINRSSFRCDGTVPTLTTTCGSLFVPRYGAHLSGKQCLALQGLNPHILDLTGQSADNLYKLAGNAMSVPVIGTVMYAAVSQLCASPGSA